MTTALPSDTPLGEARAWLRQRVDKGEHCPCCTQFAKVYRRPITSASARSLVLLWRAAQHNYAHLPTVLKHTHADEAKLAYWGLMEEEAVVRPDGGRAGWWRVTDLGERWIYQTVTVPKYARIYDGRCLGLSGDPVTIIDALGTRFDLRVLMSA